MQETGPSYGFSSLFEKTRSLILFGSISDGNTFSSIILRPWVLVWFAAWTFNLPHGSPALNNMNYNTEVFPSILKLHF